MAIDKRYERNIPSISEAEQMLLSEKTVAVVGCGGLGGYIIEHLSRIGIGHIIAIDGDVFDESNLNRQILSSAANIGQPKALCAKLRVNEINSDVDIIAKNIFLDQSNAEDILRGCDLIIDALDSIASRFIMEDAAARLKLDIVHGAICGWNIQVTIARAGDNTLHRLYQNNKSDSSQNAENKTSLSMVPACCASVQVAEALKLLLGHEPGLDGKLLMIDLKNMESSIINLVKA